MITYNEKMLGRKYLCTNNSMLGNDLYEITVLNFSDNQEYVKVKYESGNISWLRCKDVEIVDDISCADVTPLKQIGDWAEGRVKAFADTIDDLLKSKK